MTTQSKLMTKIAPAGKGPLPNVRSTCGFDGPVTTILSGGEPITAIELLNRIAAAYRLIEALEESIANAERVLREEGVLS